MSRRRYYSAASSEQLVGGGVVAAIGAFILCVLAYMVIDDPNPPLDRVAGLVGFGLAVIGVGAWIALRGRVPLVVDLQTRRVDIPARAAQMPDSSLSGSARAPQSNAWSGSLDEAGPIRVMRVTRRIYGEQFTRHRQEHRVVLTACRDWGLYQSVDYARARRVADRLAHEWSLGLAQLDGQTRGPRELDTPLWQRAPAPASGGTPSLLDSSSGVVLATEQDRTTLESKVLGGSATAPNYLVLGWTVMAGLAMSELPVQVDLASSPGARALYWLLGAAALGSGAFFLWQAAQWVLPARLGIGQHGVTYRGRKNSLSDVMEVVVAPTLLIVGRGRKAIALEPGFCAPGALDDVAAEIRRLIGEYGRRPRP